jgi:hypothetical protein
MRIKHVRAAAATTAIAAAVGLGLTASPASAASSYLHNNYATWTPASCYSGCDGSNIYPANGTSFTMQCWFDADYQKGNTWTNRYFIGLVGGHPGRWVVQASYVFNQVSVIAC